MFRIIPREENFFELFENAAMNVNEAAAHLLEFLEKFDNRAERAKKIKDLEHAGDNLTHDAIKRLNRTFITPLDREDIHQLVTKLDDVIDLMDTATNRIILYKIEKPTDDSLKLAQCLRHQTSILVEAMPLLRNMKQSQKILQHCVAIHTQENEADQIEQHALAALFENNHNPADIIKWKDIYQDLEAATDRCEDVANVLESIVLKNA